jgi:hypothetical protein
LHPVAKITLSLIAVKNVGIALSKRNNMLKIVDNLCASIITDIKSVKYNIFLKKNQPVSHHVQANWIKKSFEK